MLRFVNICLVLGLVALAYVIYQVKYEARALDEEIATLGKEIEAERDALAVLRAEWSLLNRPERIERLAQKYLKLAPAKPRSARHPRQGDGSRFRPRSAGGCRAAPAAAVTAKAAKPAGKAPAAVASAAPECRPTLRPWPQAKIVAPVQAAAQ